MPTVEVKEAEKRGFGQAVAWAIQMLITAYGDQHLALGLLQESGLSVADLEAAGADEYDLEPIRAALQSSGADHG